MVFKVFMDTNIYDGANYSFENFAFQTMREYAQKGELTLIINSVIEGEVCSHIAERVEEHIRKLNKLTKNGIFAYFRKIQPYSEIIEKQDPQKWIDTCNKGFSSLLQDCNVQHIPIDGIDVEKIVRDYFEQNPPFEMKKPDEFKDAIAVSSLLTDINETFQSKNDDNEINYCVISNDNGFCSAVETGLDEHILEKVHVFNKLNDFTKYLAQITRQTEFLKAFLLSEYWHDELIETVRYAVDDTNLDIYVDNEPFIEQQELVDVNEIKFEPYVLRIYEEEGVPTTAVVMLDVDYHLKVWYKYLDEENSYWDKEENKYLWKTQIEKEGVYHVNFSMVISLDITECVVPEDWNPNSDYDFSDKEVVFNDYFDTPTRVVLSETNLIEDYVIENGNPFCVYEENGRLIVDKPYSQCPDCGTPIGIHNDGGNGYCVICSTKREL